MRFTRSIQALILAVLMVVTSQNMAVARGTMVDASGAVVICTGTGPITVLVGADGQPITSNHICPDCALTALAGVAVTFDLSPPEQRVTRFLPELMPRSVSSLAPVPPRARAPPVV